MLAELSIIIIFLAMIHSLKKMIPLLKAKDLADFSLIPFQDRQAVPIRRIKNALLFPSASPHKKLYTEIDL
jgi:hypothetical protein